MGLQILLARIAALNQELLGSAQQGNWQRVKALEKARRAMVKDVLKDNLDPVDPCLVQCIQEIIRVDREIVRLSLVKRRLTPTAALRSSAG